MSSKRRKKQEQNRPKKYGSKVDRNGIPYVSSSKFTKDMLNLTDEQMKKEKNYKRKSKQ